MNTTILSRTLRPFVVSSVVALAVLPISVSIAADDTCETLSAIELAGPVPDLKCQDKDIYKQSVTNATFKAEKIHSDVDERIRAVQSGLTDEYIQNSYIDYVSEDSKVTGRVNIRNKVKRIVNYSLDPSSEAEQSVGAIR